MVKLRQAILGVAATAAIMLMPMAPAMANGHGFRSLHAFGFRHGLLGAVVGLATLPLVIASNVVAGVSESVAPYPSPGYAAPGYAAPAYGYAPPVVYAAPRPYYAPYPGYYMAPRTAYGPRGYYGGHPSYYGHGYYRSRDNSYPRR
ncbi:MAG: hypothetical protein ABI145_10455 [Steroidobacteraceae bacterium]